MGNGSSSYPTSADSVTRIQDGVDYIEETDPNNAYASVEAVQGFVGASGATQAHNTTILTQLVAIKPEIILEYKTTIDIYANAGRVICSNASGSIIKLRQNTSQTTITPTLGADTQYYVYAVADATATTVTFEVGTSATVAPSATTYRRIGSFLTNSSSEIIEGSIKNDYDYGFNFSKQVVRAWVSLNGTGTVAIRDSFNVASITDNGTGDYTINFLEDFADVNYVVSGHCSGNISDAFVASKGSNNGNPTVSSVRIQCQQTNLTAVDPDYVMVSIIGGGV